ncbi:MAG: hypothetical protein KatS3mg110_3682 [Pirellulaceae bacterium]|nr:MAG: hypothetical protein KatS3mg110_3682 [Pirellulaceae bacterium]
MNVSDHNATKYSLDRVHRTKRPLLPSVLQAMHLLPVCAAFLALDWGPYCACGQTGQDSPPTLLQTPLPLEPEQARQTFRLPEGLVIELVACEPDVIDPVAIRFDAAGHMWVVQMIDYPDGPPEGQPPLSRISRLTDTDGDGRYETAVVFAEHLLFPTGVQPWRDGLLVTLSGRVIWMRDTDGDGQADVSETWFEGFTEGNSQLRANHPVLALDNMIYIANGLRGGEVRDVRRPGLPVVSIRNRDFRFDPRGSFYEPVSGLGQFGLAFDDFGHRFVCSNRNPCRHVVLEDRYLARSPGVAVSEVMQDVAAFAENSRVFPLTRAWTTSNLHAHQFTAACGVLWYRGTALPEEYRNNIFVCEPTGNLVHREIPEAAGATFTSRPAYDDRDFLASTDEWFRPVNLELGPDGALYVVDMYRAVIEHPEFMPEELKRRPDLYLGRDRGRIWRIRRSGAPPRSDPVGSTPEQWLKALEHPNAWQRETAARLILENEPPQIDQALRRLAAEATTTVTKVHALWLLEGLHQLDADLLAEALEDPAPELREQALILSERFREDPSWRNRVAAKAGDADARVRFQAALWLIPARREELEALATILERSADDVWTRRAVQLAAGPLADSLLVTLVERAAKEGATRLVDAIVDVARTAGQVSDPRPEVLDRLITLAVSDPALTAEMARRALAGLLAGWARRSPKALAWLSENPRQVRWRELVVQEERAASDGALPESRRIEAMELLRFDPQTDLLRTLALDTAQPTALRVAAIRFLSNRQATSDSDQAFWETLIGRFIQELPAVRTSLVEAALARREVAERLVRAMEEGRLPPRQVAAADFARLQKHSLPDIRTRVAQLASLRVSEDRQVVLERYQPCLQLPADPRRGRDVFARHCATCHRIGSLGVDVAPDISDSRTKTPQQLLVDILQPNRAIDGNYISYIVQTSDGRVLTGIIASETATSITLRQAENKTEVLPRSDIEMIQSTGQSLMPEGLEQNISLQEMADLISFIKNWRYLPNQ